MKMRWIGRYDDGMKLLRLFRIVSNNRNVGNGQAYDWQLTFGLRLNKLFGFTHPYNEWSMTVFGFRVHWKRSFGGRFAL